MEEPQVRLALVIGCLPSIEEIDQFRLIIGNYDVQIITSESIAAYVSQNSYFQDLTCVVLKDHDENPTFLPGLENVLKSYDVVVVKERIGLYAYQVLKAKWRYQFRMFVWVDNLVPYPAHDVDQMRTIRTEVSNAADGFIVQSKAALTTLEIEGVEPSRILEMLPFVESRVSPDKKTRAMAREKLGFAEGDCIISCLGPIEWEEGLQDLMAATKLAIKEKPSLKDKVKIIICGIGSFAGQLKETTINYDTDFCVSYFAPSRESLTAIYHATDGIFMSSLPCRDRIDGDPYRILSAMANRIPVLASRSPLIEQFIGKHRIDFCQGSPMSLKKAMIKLMDASNLVKNITQKNYASYQKLYSFEAVQQNMMAVFDESIKTDIKIDKSGLDHQVLEIEAKIKSKQYMAAVDLIEALFKTKDMPIHHRSNLYRMVGDCFVKLGDYEAAKNSYISSAELDPYSSRTYIGLGTIGLMKNSYDIAVIHFQKAVSLAPDDEMANLGLGLAFQGMNEWKEAKRWIAKSVQINPENTAALYSLVKASHETEDYQQVELAIKKYLSIHPNSYNFIYTLGGIYFKSKRFLDVIALMKTITDVDPRDQKAAALLKQAQSALDELNASSSNG